VAEHVDGNVLGGALSELFGVDLTVAVGTCAACGYVGEVAKLMVYHHAPGWVARCPGCDEVVLRLVNGPRYSWLDLRGAVSLRIPTPAPA